MPMQATTTAPLFSAALKPDRSPRLTGGWVAFVAATVIAVPFGVLVPEALLPVGVALIAGAVALTTLSVQQSRRRRVTQQVTLWADQLEVVTMDLSGAKTLRRFNPIDVRLALQRDENEKTVAIHLRIGKEALELGAFLNAEDRASFARAFGTALRKARQRA